MNDPLNLLEELANGSLSDQTGLASYPATVLNRVAHIDGDFIAYQVSAESKAELDPLDPTPRKSFEDMKHNAQRAADHLRRLSGAERYVLHLTPTGSTKGGRAASAIQKPYQGNRAGKEKPEFLDKIRAFMVHDLGGTAHLDQEADDGLAQSLYQADDPYLAVVVSKDKDLRMVEGLHCDPVTGEFFLVEKGDFGYIAIDDTKSTKKLVGYGPKFFWAQLLMGDAADNVAGVPCVSGKFWQGLFPSEKYTKAVNDLIVLGHTVNYVGETKVVTSTRERCQKFIAAEDSKSKKVGVVAAYELLKDVTNNKDAFQLLKQAFASALEIGHVYSHWETGKIVTPTQALLGDMRMTWMRRTKNPDDVLVWLKEQGCL